MKCEKDIRVFLGIINLGCRFVRYDELSQIQRNILRKFWRRETETEGTEYSLKFSEKEIKRIVDNMGWMEYKE